MPLRKVRRIDFSSDEWIAGTVGMSLAEEGLYIRICALIYSRGGPIPVDQLRRTGVHGNTLNSLIGKLVSLGKILRVGDKIDQERCEKELKIAADRVENLSKIGRKGSEIRWRDNKNKELSIAPPYGAAMAGLQTHQQNNGLEGNGEQKPEQKPVVSRARAGSNNSKLDSYVSKDTPESPPSLDVPPPQTELFPPEPEKPHVRRGSRLASDWQPDAEDRAYAQKCGLDPDAVAERFADYWHAKAGQGATKLDWHATFRTWCRNEPSHQRHHGGEQRPGDNRQNPPSWSAALRRAFPDVT